MFAHSFWCFAIPALALCSADASAQSDEALQSITFSSSPIGAPMEMVFVQGGSFLMGSQPDDPSKPNYNPDASPYYNDEGPVHQVDVKSFYIAKLEVTRELWADLMGGDVETGFEQYAKGSLSYDDALHFIYAANVTFAAQMPEGSSFALPTEEQWEYAARGGVNNDQFAYAGGNALNDVAVWGGATEIPGEVATKMPNSLGIYDMSGNAVEWTQSYYSSDYESEPNQRFRVMRGGGIQSRPGRERDLRVSARSRDVASRQMKYYGVRLVLNIPDSKPTEPSTPTFVKLPGADNQQVRPRLRTKDGRIEVVTPDGSSFDVCGRRL